MSEKLVNDTINDLAEAQRTLSRLQATIEQQNRRNEEATREIARLHDQLRDVFGAVYIRLDGSVKQGTVYADKGGVLNDVREAYLQPMVDRHVYDAAPSHTRRFRLMGRVGKQYVYGEV